MSTISRPAAPAATRPTALTCAAPAKTKTESAWVSTTDSPASRASTAYASPNGTTPTHSGAIAVKPRAKCAPRARPPPPLADPRSALQPGAVRSLLQAREAGAGLVPAGGQRPLPERAAGKGGTWGKPRFPPHEETPPAAAPGGVSLRGESFRGDDLEVVTLRPSHVLRAVACPAGAPRASTLASGSLRGGTTLGDMSGKVK